MSSPSIHTKQLRCAYHYIELDPNTSLSSKFPLVVIVAIFVWSCCFLWSCCSRVFKCCSSSCGMCFFVGCIQILCAHSTSITSILPYIFVCALNICALQSNKNKNSLLKKLNLCYVLYNMLEENNYLELWNPLVYAKVGFQRQIKLLYWPQHPEFQKLIHPTPYIKRHNHEKRE